MKIAQTLQKAYSEQYTDDMTRWREVGGKYKAKNIRDLSKGFKFKKVLECGAGEGSILKYLDEYKIFKTLYAIEISGSGISQILKRGIKSLDEVLKFDGYNIPYSDKFFDMVYCSHVIEHVEHPRILLRELSRVSKFQIFEIPLDYSIQVDGKVQNFLSYGHINIYTPSLFKFLLKSEGFEIMEELFTNTAKEVVEFDVYFNKSINKNIFNILKLNISYFIKQKGKFLIPRRYYKEYGFSAYTCLVKPNKSLKIF